MAEREQPAHAPKFPSRPVRVIGADDPAPTRDAAPAPERLPLRDQLALAALPLMIASATGGGFCVSPAVGLYSLAGSSLVAALLLGAARDVQEVEPELGPREGGAS